MDNIKQILRQQAWERAKGELNSMLVTYYWEDNRFEEIENRIKEFIKNIEDDGLHE
mgnify:CR=1 FL=1